MGLSNDPDIKIYLISFISVEAMSAKPNAAIFILTQCNEVRRTYLKTCLYFLFRNFNAEFRYPVIILHEGDYTAEYQREILMSVRSSCRSLVSFVTLDADDFKVPDHIDKEKMKKCIALKPVPYWRNEAYRSMCRFWMIHFPKYTKGYDYAMRLDDDSIIEEHIKRDLFAWMAEKDLNYASNFIHSDCGICCYGLKEFLEKQYPERAEEVRKLFIKQEVPIRAVQFQPFLNLLSIIEPREEGAPELEPTKTLWSPIMYYNNYFITRTAFWSQPEVVQLVDKLDKLGGIYYLRHGDSPLQSLVVMLLSPPEKISRSSFKYSKRLQREAFLDDHGEYHSYMPETYDKSSCITESNIKQ